MRSLLSNLNVATLGLSMLFGVACDRMDPSSSGATASEESAVTSMTSTNSDATTLMDLMRNSGVPRSNPGRLGASTYDVTSLVCNPNDPAGCRFEPAAGTLSMSVSDVRTLLRNLDAERYFDHGQEVLRLKTVHCGRPVVPNPVTTCTFEAGNDSHPDADADLFTAMESSGVPVANPGALGATVYHLDTFYCVAASPTWCAFQVNASSSVTYYSGTVDVAQLWDDFRTVGANVLSYSGGDYVELLDVRCSRVVYPGAVPHCTYSPQ